MGADAVARDTAGGVGGADLPNSCSTRESATMILKKDSFVVLGMTLVFSCAGNVFSQETAQDYKGCTGQDGATADQQIKGCTAVIQSGRETTYNLAVAFYNRANAYSAKGDKDRAIQDYDHAIRLNPQYARAFSNRGIEYAHKGDKDRAIQDYD